MTLASIRLILLIAAAVAFHEVGMAMDGHGLVDAQPSPTCTEIAESTRHTHYHASRHHGFASGDEVPSPAEIAETCRDLRAVAPIPRMVAVDLDATPAAALPMPATSITELFAVTSRTVVDNAPDHPPDVRRALFQVYLI
jgi:hypothetical protein